MNSSNPNSLTGLLNSLSHHANGDPVVLGDLIKAFQRRGFGPLLLFPSLLLVLPTGAIPGMPAVCGIIIALVSFQVVIGRESPWIPKRLAKISISKKRVKRAIQKSISFSKKIDGFLDRRLEFLTSKVSQRIIGGIIFILSLFLIFFGFIPLFPVLFAVPVLFFALGYAARDGLLIALGLIVVVAGAVILPAIIQGN